MSYLKNVFHSESVTDPLINSVLDSAVDARNATRRINSTEHVQSATDARRGNEGVSLLLRVNHNNAEGRQTRIEVKLDAQFLFL